MRPGCASRDKQEETGHSTPAILFFYKTYYRRNLDTYRYYFHCVQEPYLVRLGLSGPFSTPVSITCISRAFWALNLSSDACKNRGIGGASIHFFNKIHCNYKLDTYINNFCDIRQPSLARLVPSSLFFVPARTAHISGA